MNGHHETASQPEGGLPPSPERRYQEMLGAGLDLLDQGVTVFDADLRMVAWNTAFLRLLDFPETLARPGVSFEDFIRFNAERGDYGPGDPAQQVAERVARARSFQPHTTERIRPSGRILSIRGFPLPHQGFITVYTDVTEQRRAAEQISRHQAELEEHITSRTEALTRANREITDAIPAAIAYVDKDRIYRYANKGYAGWFGWTSEQVPGHRVPEVIGQELFDTISADVDRAMAGERVSYEYRLTGRDGEPAYARSTLVPDFAPDGSVLGCYVHSMDVTEQRHTQAALAQAQKMEAIGQLTGGLAHDFNNMLTVVIGNLVALKENHPDDPLTENFVEPAMHAANRGAELIRRLLGFARRQPLEPKPVEVNELILGMSKLIRRSLPSTIAVSTASREPCLVAMVDAHQLENALLNLALNARDAMPNGGELRIESSLEHLGVHAAADLEVPPGDYVQIAVTDNGMGMDGSTLARVFEPFFTTKQFGMGSGLGMSMVYGFTKQSGGGVRIRSRQARGTTVALLLPRIEEDEAQPGLPAGRHVAAADLAGKLVLLAEDDADVRSVVRMQLAELGCAVVEAENGSEAADMVENIPAIALVISDVVMPGAMDGRALARFVRRFRPELPMVLMSGFAESEFHTSGLDPEHDLPLLAKPFSRDKLLAALSPLRN
ncbi:MAG: PAS-domain containing protein [Zoogloea sp.]|uniref:PAS-domain containing protein n=1 Tax=Zoogloea sp. TaxID=49181 RepID=UPI002617689C|nr:PAS-domain containing protein [Zoogloea sp.]MDD3327955.1 PAS-domain containing protein [Zoogloea sp.]